MFLCITHFLIVFMTCVIFAFYFINSEYQLYVTIAAQANILGVSTRLALHAQNTTTVTIKAVNTHGQFRENMPADVPQRCFLLRSLECDILLQYSSPPQEILIKKRHVCIYIYIYICIVHTYIYI